MLLFLGIPQAIPVKTISTSSTPNTENHLTTSDQSYIIKTLKRHCGVHKVHHYSFCFYMKGLQKLTNMGSITNHTQLAGCYGFLSY